MRWCLFVPGHIGQMVSQSMGPSCFQPSVGIIKASSAIRQKNMDSPIVRARTQLGKLKYRLGAGGRKPLAASPGPYCDCAGFVTWCLGFDRYQPASRSDFPTVAGGWDWVNTDSMIAAARSGKGWFQELAEPEVGCLVVYPSIYRKGERVRVGHVGIVTQVPTRWDPVIGYGRLTVIHCSAGNYKRTGSAVQETSGMPWANKGSLFLRYLGP